MNDEHAIKQTDQKEILRIAAAYFQKIFHSTINPESCRWEDLLECVNPIISEELNDMLLQDITEEENRRSVFAQGPLKAPGIDGFPSLFYQKYWSKIKDHIIRYVKVVE